MKVTGKCLCGFVRWESTAAPLATRTCWCRDCQYLAASAMTIWTASAPQSGCIDTALPRIERQPPPMA